MGARLDCSREWKGCRFHPPCQLSQWGRCADWANRSVESCRIYFAIFLWNNRRRNSRSAGTVRGLGYAHPDHLGACRNYDLVWILQIRSGRFQLGNILSVGSRLADNYGSQEDRYSVFPSWAVLPRHWRHNGSIHQGTAGNSG